MIQICPVPSKWNDVYQRLLKFSDENECKPKQPPIPLILGGWAFSNDMEKQMRWRDTVEWSASNRCQILLDGLSESDFYVKDVLCDSEIGPTGGPIKRAWDFAKRIRPSEEQLESLLESVHSNWETIASTPLVAHTTPLAFSGEKARCLLVSANPKYQPEWGSWTELSEEESKRRRFTDFRARLNVQIAPHEVDHVIFNTQTWKDGGAA